MVVRPPKTKRFGLRPPAAMTRCEPRYSSRRMHPARAEGRGGEPQAWLADALRCSVSRGSLLRPDSARLGGLHPGQPRSAGACVTFTAGLHSSSSLRAHDDQPHLGFLIADASPGPVGWLTRAHSSFYSYRTQRPGRHQTIRRLTRPQPHAGQAKPGTLKRRTPLGMTPQHRLRTWATRLHSRDESQSSRGPAS